MSSVPHTPTPAYRIRMAGSLATDEQVVEQVEALERYADHPIAGTAAAYVAGYLAAGVATCVEAVAAGDMPAVPAELARMSALVLARAEAGL